MGYPRAAEPPTRRRKPRTAIAQRLSEPQLLSEDGVHGEYPVVNVSPRGVGVAWSQRTSGEAHHAAANAPNMKDPNGRKPLAAVGGAQVMMRRAAMD